MVQQQAREAQEGSREYMAQINRLRMEKDSLLALNAEMKEKLTQLERESSELRASLAAAEARGESSSDEKSLRLGSATQKVVQLTEQNTQLHQALRKAKDVCLELKKAYAR